MTQQHHSLRREITTTVDIRYLLALPPEYEVSKDKHWPLILFLHGAGQRGDDLNAVKNHGLPKELEEGRTLPAIVVSPQCSQDMWWSNEALSVLLDDIEATYRIDSDRLYVTGLSMGGFGTWALAIAQPSRFAAIMPICGGGAPSRVCAIKHVPAWVFHGAKDSTVPVRRSEEMVDALISCGGDVRLTVYQDTGHDSWSQTYANPELYEWMLSKRRVSVALIP